MKSLTGIWEGEYLVNIGTDANPNIEYHTFRLELTDSNSKLSGKVYDLTLSNEPSVICGK